MSSVFIQRQFSFVLAAGEKASLRDVAMPTWSMRDVLPKYILKSDDKKYVGGYFRMAQNTSNTFGLPPGYVSTQRLCGYITTSGKAKVTLVSPTFGTSATLLRGSAGTTLGDHRGLHAFCSDVTSIAVAIPSTANGGLDTLIEYMLWQLPDLADADSWRDGAMALGVES